jgi:hypothetical protein
MTEHICRLTDDQLVLLRETIEGVIRVRESWINPSSPWSNKRDYVSDVRSDVALLRDLLRALPMDAETDAAIREIAVKITRDLGFPV